MPAVVGKHLGASLVPGSRTSGGVTGPVGSRREQRCFVLKGSEGPWAPRRVAPITPAGLQRAQRAGPGPGRSDVCIPALCPTARPPRPPGLPGTDRWGTVWRAVFPRSRHALSRGWGAAGRGPPTGFGTARRQVLYQKDEVGISVEGVDSSVFKRDCKQGWAEAGTVTGQGSGVTKARGCGERHGDCGSLSAAHSSPALEGDPVHAPRAEDPDLLLS